MKMSDVFKLPLSEEQVCNRLGCAWAIDKDKVEAVASAINNHDRLEQEVAELKEVVQDLLACKGILTSDKECVIKAKQLLNK